MTTAATAKILLLVALSLGSRSTPDTILATSNSDNYVWTRSGGQWELKTKGLPADEWISQGQQASPQSHQEREFRAIAHHQWRGNSVLDLEDGSQVSQQNGTVFYIENPGAPNQKTFTILYSASR